MRHIAKLAGGLAALLLAWQVHAGVIVNGDAVFDDANDLLVLRGTYTSATVPIEGLLFDWDGALNLFNFSGSSLLSSNLGGSLTTPAPGFLAGSILIAGFPSSPLTVPVSFELLLSVPGAGADFLTTPIDFYLCSNCFTSPSYDFDNGAFLTPRAGDLAAVPLPGTLALLGLGIAVLAYQRRRIT